MLEALFASSDNRDLVAPAKGRTTLRTDSGRWVMPREIPERGPTLKICIVCGIDLSGKRRMKDRRGRYYCDPCRQQLVERHRKQQADVRPEEAPAFAPDAAPLDDLSELTQPAARNAPPLPLHPTAGTREWTAPAWLVRLWDTSDLPACQRYKVLGVRYRVGGIFLQLLPAFIAALMANTSAGSWLDSEQAMDGFMAVCGLIVVLGVGVFTAGLAYYAMFKGRSPHWCVAGLFGIPGLLVLMILEDQWVEPRKPVRFGY